MATETVKLRLRKPVDAYGESVSELVLRRPTVKELRQCGAPYRIGNGGVQWDYDACYKLIIALGGMPSSTVDDLDPADFDDAAAILVGFTKGAPVAATESGSASTN